MINWTPFWFDSNSAWGLADTPEAWQAIRANWDKGAHCMKGDEIYLAKSAGYDLARTGVQSFGWRVEHIGGRQTLREFFAENGMPL